MRYQDILLEGRDAGLYHITSLTAAVEILKADGFLNHLHMTRTMDHPFSRTKPVMFVLSQERLSHRYPIEPRFGDIEQGWGVQGQRENEEYIGRTVQPAHQYIDSIFINPDWLYADSYKREAKQIVRLATKYGIRINQRRWFSGYGDDRTQRVHPIRVNHQDRRAQ